MTREELYNSICPYLVDCENTNCDSCNEILNRLFDKYDKQIIAEAIEECIAEINRQFKDGYGFGVTVYPHTICNILEHLKEQRKE